MLGRWRRDSKRRDDNPPRSHDPADGDYWRQLPIGSSVVLRDFQALEEAHAEADGVNYEVVARRRYQFFAAGSGDHHSVVGEYLLFDIEAASVTHHLVAVLGAAGSGGRPELRVYYRPDGFEPGNRATLLDAGFAWLFAEPPNLDDFVPYELDYAPRPDVPPIDDGGEEQELDFVASGGGPRYGQVEEPGGHRIPVIAVEYRAQQQASNPLMLILEEGGLDTEGDAVPEGGFVSLFLGSQINSTQMDVYAV